MAQGGIAIMFTSLSADVVAQLKWVYLACMHEYWSVKKWAELKAICTLQFAPGAQ